MKAAASSSSSADTPSDVPSAANLVFDMPAQLA